MEISAGYGDYSTIDADVLLVPVFQGDVPGEGLLGNLDSLTEGGVRPVFDSHEIDGKPNQWALIYNTGRLKARRLALYCAGKLADLNSLSLQRLAGSAVSALAARGMKSIAFLLRPELNRPGQLRALAEGALIAQQKSNLYSSDAGRSHPIDRLLIVTDEADAQPYIDEVELARLMADATNFARTLGNEPANVLTPAELARRAHEMGEREGLKTEIFGQDEIRKMGMGAILAVAQGSVQPPRLIVLSYEPPGAESGKGRVNPAESGTETIALVGKGVTFDSGGISIKPGLKMDEMKFDMCGGAAVIGAMQVVARLRPKVRVLGIVPASENLPSGTAFRPGDVIRSMSGKTIEIINTDAEGRLLLADAITFAISRGATRIVDVATLTGACVVAFAGVRAAVLGNDQKLVDDLMAAGEECGERFWQMPINKEYGDLVRSEIADLRNEGNRSAGAITAAMFLKAFAGSLPWAHLDIAGTAWIDKSKPYLDKGATGFGVRTLAGFVMKHSGSV